MIFRLAWRNLLRNRWRTALTVAGVMVAVAMLVWTMAYMAGFSQELVVQSTQVDIGQVNIMSKEYAERAQVRHSLEFDDEFAQRIKEVPGVEAVSQRVMAFGLVGNEERSVIAKLVGIDPQAERGVTIVADRLVEGRWISDTYDEEAAAREVVVGKKFADQLGLGVGGELVTFFEAADGALGNDLFTIVGLVETRNSSVDRQSVYLHIEAMQYSAALEGQVNEVAIRVADVSQSEQIAAAIEAQLKDDTLAVRPWPKLVPEISDMVTMMDKMDVIWFSLIYLIVGFGLFNAQRMSALERTREFGVIRAVGVTPFQLFASVLFESVFITLLGALAGAGLGFLISYYFEIYGLDMSAWTNGEDVGMMGVSLDSLKFVVNLKVVFKPVIYIVPVAFICGLWPAWKASQLEITSAISGRT